MVGAVLVDKWQYFIQRLSKAFGKEHAEVSALKKWKEVPKKFYSILYSISFRFPFYQKNLESLMFS